MAELMKKWFVTQKLADAIYSNKDKEFKIGFYFE